MTTINITAFSGISPRTGITQLSPNQAQVASNAKLQSGELRPWRNPLAVYTPVNAGVKSFYKLVGASSYVWFEFTTDTDVVGSLAADVSDYRAYYSSTAFGVGPRKTNWALANGGSGAYPQKYLELGVPAPAAAPTLSASGGTAPAEVRAYVYTYISTFGALTEESAPSPAQTVTVNSSGATVAVSGWSTAPTANYNITGIRIYRTVTGASTVSYQYVDQIPVTPGTGAVVSGGTSTGGVTLSGTTYNDTLGVGSLGPVMTSLYYTPPPATLQGFVVMPNGMLAGFTGNQVWFSEPYLAHAWPVGYMQTVDSPIVGLGVYGNTLVVMTTQKPYLMTGTTPSQITVQRLPMPQPCASKRSIAFDQYGVVYASPNGLVGIGNGIQDLITTPLFTRDEWQLLQPSTMVGLVYNNLYFAFYTNASNVQSSMVLARNDTPPLTTYDYPVSGVFVNRTNALIYAVNSVDGKIYQLDADPYSNTTYVWQSKRFIESHPVNFSALKVSADFPTLLAPSVSTAVATYDTSMYTATISPLVSLGGDLNGGAVTVSGAPTLPTWYPNPNSMSVPSPLLNTYMINGSALQAFPTNNDSHFITVTVFADGTQVFSSAITSADPVRMPATGKWYAWELLITGTVACRQIAMSTSIGELRGLSPMASMQTVSS